MANVTTRVFQGTMADGSIISVDVQFDSITNLINQITWNNSGSKPCTVTVTKGINTFGPTTATIAQVLSVLASLALTYDLKNSNGTINTSSTTSVSVACG